MYSLFAFPFSPSAFGVSNSYLPQSTAGSARSIHILLSLSLHRECPGIGKPSPRINGVRDEEKTVGGGRGRSYALLGSGPGGSFVLLWSLGKVDGEKR